jgi:hypothetical protein
MTPFLFHIPLPRRAGSLGQEALARRARAGAFTGQLVPALLTAWI